VQPWRCRRVVRRGQFPGQQGEQSSEEKGQP
jgi:hypothetical protein